MAPVRGLVVRAGERALKVGLFLFSQLAVRSYPGVGKSWTLPHVGAGEEHISACAVEKARRMPR